MEDPLRRRMIIAGLAGVGSIAVVGGGAAMIDSAYASGAYEVAVRDTWRHSASFDLPIAAAQKELIRYATLAANSHNTQPWRFGVSDRSILVAPDLDRRLPSVDPDNHHLYASLGCATENLIQAAAAFGLRATPSFDAATGGINIGLETSAPTRSRLFDAIPMRQSTRGLFDARPAPSEQLRQLEADGNVDGVELRLFTERKQIEEILGYIVAGDSAALEDEAYIAELKTWLRFNASEALQTADGLFSKASGNPTLPSWLGRLIFGLVITKDGENKKCEAQLRSSSGVAVFISEKNNPESWIASGRSSQRFALRATALGIRHCFVNQPVEVPIVRGQFAAYLGVGSRRPDLVMRFGYGAELPRSLRRPVNQVLFPS